MHSLYIECIPTDQALVSIFDNLRNAPLAPDDVWGIRFSAGSITRGFINNSGQWGLLKPSSAYQISPAMFNNILKTISNLTIGVEGWVCAEGFSVRALDPSNSNTLDLLTTGSKIYYYIKWR